MWEFHKHEILNKNIFSRNAKIKKANDDTQYTYFNIFEYVSISVSLGRKKKNGTKSDEFRL